MSEHSSAGLEAVNSLRNASLSTGAQGLEINVLTSIHHALTLANLDAKKECYQ